jgi:hypothetical protein
MLNKELVNIFNLNNYYADNINTNFTVEGGKVVVLLERDVDVKRYIEGVKKEIMARHGGSEGVTGIFFDLKSFPFRADERQCVYSENGRVKKLVIDVDSKVLFNFKLHFAMEFQRVIELEVIKNLEERGIMTEEDSRAYMIESVQPKSIEENSTYLYYISIDNERFKNIFVTTYESRLSKFGFDSSVLFTSNSHGLYIKDINNVELVKALAKDATARIALRYDSSGDENSKVKNAKDLLKDKIFNLTKVNGENGVIIDGFDCDVFTDKNERDGGNGFALVPFIKVNGELEALSTEDVTRINEAFRKRGIGNILSDVNGKTENTQFADIQEPVYGISNTQLAPLIPELMKYPIIHNKVGNYFDYALNFSDFLDQELHSSSRPSSSMDSTRVEKGKKEGCLQQ